MQDIIRKIISIDQAAMDVVKINERDIKVREEIARNEIEQMKTQSIEQAKQQGQRLYEERVLRARAEADRIRTQGVERMQALEGHYTSIKEELECRIFRRIFVDAIKEELPSP